MQAQPERANWQWLKSVLANALEKSRDDRIDYLEQACAERPDMRSELDSLLCHADAGLEDFLEDAPEPPPAAERPERDLIGLHAGPYRIVRKIGFGGMGRVYLAERKQRAASDQVAIKIIRGDIDSPALRRRFECEQQLHARLVHPFVVRLIDRETIEGQPCMVLEHVDGPPIDVFCRNERLGLKARVALFTKVCAAVQHVHDHAVIHCDIKSANILIAQNGSPKLLDFGVAERASAVRGPTRTCRLRRRDDLTLFTPECAAPEQLQLEPATRATDIYALGLLLLRLLTDKLPAASRGETAGIPDWLVTLEFGDTCSVPAAARQSLTSHLNDILQRALAFDPAGRYFSALALGNDLRRCLRDR